MLVGFCGRLGKGEVTVEGFVIWFVEVGEFVVGMGELILVRLEEV